MHVLKPKHKAPSEMTTGIYKSRIYGFLTDSLKKKPKKNQKNIKPFAHLATGLWKFSSIHISLSPSLSLHNFKIYTRASILTVGSDLIN